MQEWVANGDRYSLVRQLTAVRGQLRASRARTSPFPTTSSASYFGIRLVFWTGSLQNEIYLMPVNTSALSAAELAALFAVSESAHGRTGCLLHLLLETGMRLDEAVTLDPASILGGGACVIARRMRESDGLPAAFIAVTSALHARLAELGRTGHLFKVPEKSDRESVYWWRARLRQVFADAGLEGSSVYRLRKTYLASFSGEILPPRATNRRLRRSDS